MIAQAAGTRWIAGDVAPALGATVEGDSSATFVAVVTDSREARPGSAFFALDGSRHRGAEFVPAAFGSGCSVVVVPMDWRGEIPPGRCALRVSDPLAALVGLARARRDAWTCPVLAVTGSAGKTTVKEMTAHVLAADRRVLRSPGNFNTPVGLSRTILDAKEAPEIAVLETGASAPGEIARLAGLVRPTAACVTNVAPAHLEGFGSVARVREEKLDLLRAVPPGGARLVDGDDPELVRAAEREGARVTKLGTGPENEPRLARVEILPDGGTRYRLADGTEGTLAVPGEHQAKNALFAIAFAQAHGVARGEAARRLATFRGVPGRLALRTVAHVLIADDSYNSNPASARAALQWFEALPREGRKAVALGDMLELGADAPRHHEELGRSVAGARFDLAVFVGESARAAWTAASATLAPGSCVHRATSEEAAALVAAWVRPGDAVLVKGSRGIRMERVVEALAAREESGAR
ncbi:MAG: UDP-N-acetylmuramoyl-tripeptide--D-alanyl-D-alanine ligase [bacterium]